MNCILMHGMSSHLEQTFGEKVALRAKNAGFDVCFPHFPLKKDITLDGWYKVAEKYINLIDKDSVIICHSLSTLFILKFLRKYKLDCHTLIAVAGGYDSEINDEKFLYLKDFMPSMLDFEYVKQHTGQRYAIYSNDDHIFSQKQLHNYIEMLQAQPIFIKDCGHFGMTSGVKDIPIITHLLSKTNNS